MVFIELSVHVFQRPSPAPRPHRVGLVVAALQPWTLAKYGVPVWAQALNVTIR